MSEDLLAILITLAILAALFLWVPTLDICGDHCRRLLLRRRKPGTGQSPATYDVNRAA